MSWVEGVGDEVTITVTVLVGLAILVAAWLTTGIREIRFISVIIVQLRRRVGGQPIEPIEPLNPAVDNTPNTSTSEHAESESEHDASIATSQENVDTNVIENTDNAALGADRSDSSIILNEDDVMKTGATGGDDLNSTEKHVNNESELEGHVLEEFVAETEETNNTQESQLHDELKTEESSLSENELRRRRVQFFSGQSDQSCSSANDESSENRTSACVNERVQETIVTPINVPKLDVLSDTSSPQPASRVEDVEGVVDSSTESRADEGSNRSQQESQGATETSGVNVGQSPPDEIRVRIKFFNDTQKLVTSPPSETIGTFRQKHFPAELSQSKLVRFIFNGQDLRNDSSTLQSYNIIDNSVLHCLITQPRQQDQQQQQQLSDDDSGLDLGLFIYPLFGVLLGILWYVRLMYKQFFNVKSTLILAAMTMLYLAAFLASRRQRNRPALEQLE